MAKNDLMSANNRREKILKVIQEKKIVKISDLRDSFGVSSVTIGKDLAYWEAEGMIVKHFGMAEIRNTDHMSARSNISNYENKKRLAKHALRYIKANDSIFLYMGSTVLAMARMLPEQKRLNILTNSFEIAHDIKSNSSYNVLVLGGYYNDAHRGTYGEIAARQLCDFNIDKAFLTCNGISAEKGLAIDDPFEKSINEALVAHAEKCYLLMTGEKIGRGSFIQFAPVEAIDVLITSADADPEECDKIREKGVEVVVV